MLKKLYDKIFRKKTEEVNFLSSLEILISKEETDKPKLNIALDNFEEDSINALCQILTLCANEYFFLNVVEVVKEQFILNERLEELEALLVHVAAIELKDKVKLFQREATEQPCIRPSDIQL
jgi:hypothetical protein